MRGKGLFFFLFCQLLGLNFLELDLYHETHSGGPATGCWIGWARKRSGLSGGVSLPLCLCVLQWVLPSECMFLKDFPIIFHLSSVLFFFSVEWGILEGPWLLAVTVSSCYCRNRRKTVWTIFTWPPNQSALGSPSRPPPPALTSSWSKLSMDLEVTVQEGSSILMPSYAQSEEWRKSHILL